MKMLYTFRELEKILKSDYQIKKAIADGRIFRVEKGIYSQNQFVHPLDVVTKKYPHAVFTMDSAFYFHGLSDVIPGKMYLAVKRNSTKINNPAIVPVFVTEKFLDIGKTQITFEGVTINAYNKERMLIELIRNKKSMAYDYYKEIIGSYRKIMNSLDTESIEDYSRAFDFENYIFRTIQEEVF
jgi:predicted transcriptional regulator of viral defense system